MEDGVAGRPVTGLPPPRPERAALRLAQYNVQALAYFRSSAGAASATAAGICDLLLGTQSDVVILQEFTEAEQQAWPLDPEREPLAHGLAQRLAAAGFAHQHLALGQIYPTFVASRLPLAPAPLPAASQHALSSSCTALRLRVCTAGGRAVEVLACHLDFQIARKRLEEARALLACALPVDAQAAPPAVLLAADFNQPRACDYTAEEWGWIMAWRAEHGEGASDGVDELLQGAGFACAYDAEGAGRNWPAGAPPPPTHWSGMSIDRAYSKGLACCGVYIHPSALSDHHPVITDWRWAEGGGEGKAAPPGVKGYCGACSAEGE